MDTTFLRSRLHHPLPGMLKFSKSIFHNLIVDKKHVNLSRVYVKVHFDSVIHLRKPPKYLRYPRRTKLPPDFGFDTYRKPENEINFHSEMEVQDDWRSDDSVESVAFNNDKDVEATMRMNMMSGKLMKSRQYLPFFKEGYLKNLGS